MGDKFLLILILVCFNGISEISEIFLPIGRIVEGDCLDIINSTYKKGNEKVKNELY